MPFCGMTERALPAGHRHDGAELGTGARFLALGLDQAGGVALDDAVEPCRLQHLPGKVGALAGQVGHLGAALSTR